jgi:predicted transposase/invertase (TIGR01784 family)
MTEWNWDVAKEVWFEEGMEEGREQGREEGREEGREQGRGQGLKAAKKEDARNALAKGFTPEIISEITGLDVETIRQLSTQQAETPEN